MHSYSDYFKTLHDETGPTGYLGRGTHYSVLRAMTFHDPIGKSLPTGQFIDFAVIWDEDHDVRVIEPIEEIYRRGLLSSFVMFGERKGAFTAALSNKVTTEIRTAPFNPALLTRVDELQLSLRSANCLSNDNIIYLGDLVQKTEAEMLRVPNFGRRSLNEIREILVQIGLHLGMDVQGWPPENPESLLKYTTRVSFLKAEVNSICESLSDPWNSDVVPIESKDNSIINDEHDRIALYLKNLEMLWQLGIQTKQRDERLVAPDKVQAGYVIDLTGRKDGTNR